MINPEDFPHVEEAFICLKRTNRAETLGFHFKCNSILQLTTRSSQRRGARALLAKQSQEVL